jgi:ribosomal-protein-alanine N-acetyltransferase
MAAARDALIQPACRFRLMNADDVGQLIELEQSVYPFPWSEQIFRDCLRVGYDCWVVDAASRVRGYGVMSMGAGECHILNLCVGAELRRRGVGRALLSLLLARARRAGMLHAFLEVRPSNTVAISMYEALGFERIGLRRGYYQAHGGREDALVYRRALDLLPDAAARGTPMR